MDNKIQGFLDEMNQECNAVDFLERKKRSAENIKKSSDFNEKLQYHKVLGNEVRFLIYKLLQDDPLCTCALAKLLDMSEGSITHHLKKLEKAGLVFGNKKGHFTVYYTKSKLLEIIK